MSTAAVPISQAIPTPSKVPPPDRTNDPHGQKPYQKPNSRCAALMDSQEP